MRKRKLRLALAILLLAVLGGLTWLVVAPHDPPEPVYQGKHLSEWLDERSFGRIPDSSTEQAVRQIGTNGIPTMLRMLRTHDSTLKLKLIGLAKKQHLVKISFVPADQQHYAAEAGFKFLGSTASNAVPALIKIYQARISWSSQMYTAVSLRNIGPAASAAVPMLLRSAANTNSDALIRANAMIMLVDMKAKPEFVIPVLIKCLHDPDSFVQMSAARALKSMGSDAKAAVPTLVASLKDQDFEKNKFTKEALKAIDPKAAAKAGIK